MAPSVNGKSGLASRREPRATLDPFRPYAFHVESERAGSGQVVNVASVLLTNRECPWHCVFCDLWRHTLRRTVPLGAIPAQIDCALSRLATTAEAPPVHLKLYNAGSFFDRRAIPPGDYPAIAERACRFARVIVECHPALVDDPVPRFRDLLAERAARVPTDRRAPSPRLRLGHPSGTRPSAAGEGGSEGASSRSVPRLEVAMGLETAHPQVLARLNKQMTLDQFTRAAEFLRRHDIALRAFILLQPPFLPEPAEALAWAHRSVQFAFDCGASVAVLIPTRGGTPALEALAAGGEFAPPKLAALEAALEQGLAGRRGRVFADLWDLERFAECPHCFPARASRLREMNLSQATRPPVVCARCGRQP